MTVREATPEDLPRLRAIQTVVLAEPWPELLAIGVDGPPLCLVYADPDPVGYALAIVDGSEAGGDGTDSRDDGPERGGAYLAELAVAEGHRGEGRGSALLSALVSRLRERGVGRLRVTVRVSDERARSFYEDHGFAVAERLPDKYEDGDGLLLVRSVVDDS
jgi:ribosomal-protein-alanine N-acetyltransferase